MSLPHHDLIMLVKSKVGQLQSNPGHGNNYYRNPCNTTLKINAQSELRRPFHIWSAGRAIQLYLLSTELWPLIKLLGFKFRPEN